MYAFAKTLPTRGRVPLEAPLLSTMLAARPEQLLVALIFTKSKPSGSEQFVQPGSAAAIGTPIKRRDKKRIAVLKKTFAVERFAHCTSDFSWKRILPDRLGRSSPCLDRFQIEKVTDCETHLGPGGPIQPLISTPMSAENSEK